MVDFRIGVQDGLMNESVDVVEVGRAGSLTNEMVHGMQGRKERVREENLENRVETVNRVEPVNKNQLCT